MLRQTLIWVTINVLYTYMKEVTIGNQGDKKNVLCTHVMWHFFPVPCISTAGKQIPEVAFTLVLATSLIFTHT